MFTSAIKRDSQEIRRREIAWTGFLCLLFAIVCAIFEAVYECFSHEVYSYYMLYAFLFQLAGGALPCTALALSRKVTLPGKPAVFLYNSGLAANTVGCIMKGVLEIYETENVLLTVYAIVGTGLMLLGLLCYGTATVLQHRINQRDGQRR